MKELGSKYKKSAKNISDNLSKMSECDALDILEKFKAG